MSARDVSAAAPPGDAGPHPVAERFNRWAADYEASDLQVAFYGPLHRETLQMAARAFPHPRRILDVGCDTAHLLRDADRYFPDADFVGVDIDIACPPCSSANEPGSGGVYLGHRSCATHAAAP